MSGVCAGRTALVTGASRGIGAAIARRLAAEGARLALVARSLDAHPHLPGTLRETAAAIASLGGEALCLPADLSDAGSRAEMLRRAREELGPIDILVNNAAAAYYLPLERVTEKRWRIAFEVNVTAVFDLCQRVVPEMRARGGGWILNLSSATARAPQGPPYTAWEERGGDLVYGSSKAALERLSAGLAAELYRDGIAVNALAPVAAVRTPGVEALGVELSPEQVEPVEVIAEAALALCTGDPARLTGRLARSGPLLRELGRPVRSLDGRRRLAGPEETGPLQRRGPPV